MAAVGAGAYQLTQDTGVAVGASGVGLGVGLAAWAALLRAAVDGRLT